MKLGIIISMFPELHETFIVRELAALERQGVDFTIYSLQYPRDPVTIEDAKRLMEQRTHYAPLLSVASLMALVRNCCRHPLRMLKMLWRLVAAGWSTPKELAKSFAILPITFLYGDKLKADGIQHVHGHWANVPTTACWILSQVQGVTWSAAIHGEDIFSKNPLLETKLNDAKFIAVCTGYFCQHLKHNMNSSHPDDIHLNYHGLDPKVLERIANSPEKTFVASDDTKTILSIGRLVATKGHDDLIRAVKWLKDHNVSVELKLIGSGPEENALKELVAELGVEGHVTFLGMMSFAEVMDHMQQADVFGLACRMIPGTPPDGIPNVLAEAMAFGIPVVSTTVSAIPELVEHGVSGLLVDPDQPEHLAKALERVLTDHEFARTLSLEAKSKVDHMFDQQKNIDELIELFQRYVGPVGGSTS